MDFSKISKIIGINLAIFLVYAGVLFSIGQLDNHGGDLVAYMLIMMIGVALQCLVCFGIAIYYFIVGKTDFGAGYILSALAVGVIGFSTCMGSLYLEPMNF